MKKYHFITYLLIFFLTGCWDQHSLKDSALVLSIAFDQIPKDNIKATASVRTNISKGDQTEATNYIINDQGATVRDVRNNIDYQIPGSFSANKLLVMLLGEKLAKNNLYPYFDNFFRFIRSPLTSRVAIVKGQASSIIEMKTYKDIFISESLSEMLEAAENISVIPKETQETIYKKMDDPGSDLVLPYLEKTNDETIKIKGVALLENNQFTGKVLNNKQSKLLLLLQDKKSNTMSLSEPLGNNNEVISFKVKSIKRNIQIKNEERPKVRIDLKIKIDLTEYTGENLASNKKKKEIENKIAENIKKELNEVFNILQDANCDALGIGRYLMAYHPDIWKKLNWEKDYSKVQCEVNTKVFMYTSGIIL
ncbi:Ger(x)C family spore germination protein [Gottfriedia acidiceleris]|uniref:Ger(x)C family spore germination protein n=1 Tax=Gottfriedia acidiceleris TaxID=371036 RepID=UPI000B44E436|nr:Ger(x)C family spore germination protein [Gottfriedia acidiceleris]